MTPEQIGVNIARLRDLAGLTISGLAERAGMTRANLSNIEAGKRGMLVHTLVAIATALDVNVSDILGEPSPAAEQFTPQPYPLFLAEWNNGNPLAGRIIAWVAKPGVPPIPVVMYEDQGHTWFPVEPSMRTGPRKPGPLWVRDTYDEAMAAATAYRPPKR